VDLDLLLEASRPLLPATVDLRGAFEVQIPGSGEYAYTVKSVVAWSADEVFVLSASRWKGSPQERAMWSVANTLPRPIDW